MKSNKEILEEIYQKLYGCFGPQYWWPGETDFEVILGAILTQNTAWSNVEKAIKNLRKKGFLNPGSLKSVPLKKLANLIRPSGYYNQKAKKIKNFIEFLFTNYQGSLRRMFSGDFLILRSRLLEVNGIGPETADSILLYAGRKPIFVVDAYTRRILSRHSLVNPDASYAEIQNYFMDNLKNDTGLFNEYHALLVRLAKEACKAKPNCSLCPLAKIEESIRYSCDSCSRHLGRPEDRYILEVKLYASPEVELNRKEVKKNLREEIKRLIEESAKMDKKELEEEVYVCYKLILCKKCRDVFNKRLKHKEFV